MTPYGHTHTGIVVLNFFYKLFYVLNIDIIDDIIEFSLYIDMLCVFLVKTILGVCSDTENKHSYKLNKSF